MGKNSLQRWKPLSPRVKKELMALERPRYNRADHALDLHCAEMSQPTDVINNRRRAIAARYRLSQQGYARLNMPLFGVTPDLRLKLIKKGVLVIADTLLQNKDATLSPEVWVKPWLYILIAKYIDTWEASVGGRDAYKAATKEITAVLRDPAMQSALVAERDLMLAQNPDSP